MFLFLVKTNIFSTLIGAHNYFIEIIENTLSRYKNTQVFANGMLKEKTPAADGYCAAM